MAGDIRVVVDQVHVHLLAESPGVQRALERVARDISDEMRRMCPVSPPGPLHRSGALRQSIRARRIVGGWSIGPERRYGRYVNEGTPPHRIVSHGPWPLRNLETGEVFGRVVHHPGTRATHFVERAGEIIDGRTYRL